MQCSVEILWHILPSNGFSWNVMTLVMLCCHAECCHTAAHVLFWHCFCALISRVVSKPSSWLTVNASSSPWSPPHTHTLTSSLLSTCAGHALACGWALAWIHHWSGREKMGRGRFGNIYSDRWIIHRRGIFPPGRFLWTSSCRPPRLPKVYGRSRGIQL